MGDIRIEAREEGVVVVTMDRPRARNAFDDPLIEVWIERLQTVARSSPRCVVLTGQGEAFCAGYDIGGIDPGQPLDSPLPDARFERVIHALEQLPCPVVAALHGDAFGGGLDLALACDIRVAAPQVKLAMTPCRLGLVYNVTGVARFIARLGAPLTRRLFLTALPLLAVEAEKLGIVELAPSAPAVLPSALSVAGRIASNAPLAVAGLRRTIRELEASALAGVSAEVYAELQALRRSAFSSEDLREGLAAFADKRSPRFQAR